MLRYIVILLGIPLINLYGEENPKTLLQDSWFFPARLNNIQLGDTFEQLQQKENEALTRLPSYFEGVKVYATFAHLLFDGIYMYVYEFHKDKLCSISLQARTLNTKPIENVKSSFMKVFNEKFGKEAEIFEINRFDHELFCAQWKSKEFINRLTIMKEKQADDIYISMSHENSDAPWLAASADDKNDYQEMERDFLTIKLRKLLKNPFPYEYRIPADKEPLSVIPSKEQEETRQFFPEYFKNIKFGDSREKVSKELNIKLYKVKLPYFSYDIYPTEQLYKIYSAVFIPDFRFLDNKLCMVRLYGLISPGLYDGLFKEELQNRIRRSARFLDQGEIEFRDLKKYTYSRWGLNDGILVLCDFINYEKFSDMREVIIFWFDDNNSVKERIGSLSPEEKIIWLRGEYLKLYRAKRVF